MSRRLALLIVVLLAATVAAGHQPRPGFVKAVVHNRPYAPMPGVPPALPVDLLLPGLNAAILERYEAGTLIEIHTSDVETLRQRARNYVSVSVEEQFDLIYINGRVLDARNPPGTYPPGDVPDAPYPDGVQGMWLIQFIGPIKEEWLDAVNARGVTLVQYIRFHTYIAAGTNEQLAAVKALRFIQWTSQMHRFMKLAQLPPPGTAAWARIFMAQTTQTGEAISFLERLSSLPITSFLWSPVEVHVYGFYKERDIQSILAHPLVWIVITGGEVLLPDVPAVPASSLAIIAGALAACALLRLARD